MAIHKIPAAASVNAFPSRTNATAKINTHDSAKNIVV